MSDYAMNLLAVIFMVINLLFNIYYSNIKSPYWWCDPKGLMAFPLFLSTAGLSIYYVTYGEYPKLFGLEEENIPLALFSLIFASWAFTAGTFLTATKITIRRSIPSLYLDDDSLRRFSSLLIWLIVLVSLVSYYGLYMSDFFTLLSLQYGVGQWETIDSSPWLRISVIGTPLVSTLFLVWGNSKRSLFHPTLILISLFSLLPAIFLGGRKDAIFIMIAIAFSIAMRRRANEIKPIVYAILLIGTFNYIQAISRDSESLDFAGRLSSLTNNEKNENSLIGQVSIALPIMPTITAAMTVFPNRQGYYFGLSYLQTIAGTAIPKIIWDNANSDSPNLNFHKLYYPEVIDFSMDYSLAAEGYQNFGLAGIPIAYFILGCFLSNLKHIAILFPGSLWGLINLVVFQAGMWSLRSDSNTFFKMSAYTSVFLFVLYLLSTYKSKIKTRRHHTASRAQ